MNSWTDEKLLKKLGTSRAGIAWKVFLDKYSAVILSVAKQYQHDQQNILDCYLYVCEKLTDDQFRRLRAWRRQGDVRFSSWLRAVVTNLCVDWHRSENGRHRQFRSIAELSDLERLVYKLRFEQGASIQGCYAAVSGSYPELTEIELTGIIRALNRQLTPRQHWIMATRKRALVSFDDAMVRREVSLTSTNIDNPEEGAASDQEQQHLEAAMNLLTAKQSLILKLRYQQGLTLKEVAQLAGFEDPFKARYQIRLALDRLKELLRD